MIYTAPPNSTTVVNLPSNAINITTVRVTCPSGSNFNFRPCTQFYWGDEIFQGLVCSGTGYCLVWNHPDGCDNRGVRIYSSATCP